jgi:hypothetical protein
VDGVRAPNVANLQGVSGLTTGRALQVGEQVSVDCQVVNTGTSEGGAHVAILRPVGVDA